MMDRRLPDDKTVRSALMLAVRAPSVHNSQPWLWRVADRSIHLYADRSRHLPATDPDGRDLVISCGAGLHHLRTALAALGWSSTVHRFPNPDDRDHLAAIEPRDHVPALDDVALASAIPRRRTDRRLYSSWAIPTSLLDELAEQAAEEGVIFRPVADPAAHHRLLVAIDKAERARRGDPDYLAELAAWSGGHESTEGVPAANIPPARGYGELRVREFSWPELPQPRDAFAEEGTGTLATLGTTSDDLVSWLRAGEALSTVLLHATRLGLAGCPLTQPLELPATRAEIRTEVLGDGAYPQAIVRIGWPHLTADPLPTTPRRPLADVVERLGVSR